MLMPDPDPFGPAVAPERKAPARRRAAPDPTPPEGYTGPIEFVIQGQPFSKANRRQMVTIGGKPQLIKSKEAREYEAMALRQIPPKARLQLQCPVAVTMRIFYASERPDLDESVVLDVLQNRYAKVKETGERVLIQAGVYVNDRQVREKHVFHGIDKGNPRCEIRVESISRQEALL